VIGHHRYPAAWVLVPEKFDLLDRGFKIVAGVNDEKKRLVWLKFAREQIIGARYRS
jgi:hypothetical protein